MIGIGTIVNVLSIAMAGFFGIFIGGKLKEEYREGINQACGVSVLFVGIGGALQHMLGINGSLLETRGSMMMISSLVLGALLGEILHIEQGIEAFGEWLKQKTGNSDDASFVNGFVVASLTVCVGAMAVVGAIQDGIARDPSILFTKSILDFVIILIMAASLGKGCGFSAIPVGLFQGSITILSSMLEPLMTEEALSNLSLVGNVMIFCVGVNLIWGRKFRVANMLPGLVIAVLWAFLPMG